MINVLRKIFVWFLVFLFIYFMWLDFCLFKELGSNRIFSISLLSFGILAQIAAFFIILFFSLSETRFNSLFLPSDYSLRLRLCVIFFPFVILLLSLSLISDGLTGHKPRAPMHESCL